MDISSTTFSLSVCTLTHVRGFWIHYIYFTFQWSLYPFFILFSFHLKVEHLFSILCFIFNISFTFLLAKFYRYSTLIATTFSKFRKIYITLIVPMCLQICRQKNRLFHDSGGCSNLFLIYSSCRLLMIELSNWGKFNFNCMT